MKFYVKLKFIITE